MEQLDTNEAEQVQDTHEKHLYAINPLWYTEHKVSLAHLTRARRCLQCQEEGYAMPSSRGKRKKKAGSASIGSWEVEMAAIRRCCATKAGYITPQTSLLEAIFRLLLQNENQPSTDEELYEGIGKWWAGLEYLRELNLAQIRRLLAQQATYGVTAVSSR